MSRNQTCSVVRRTLAGLAAFSFAAVLGGIVGRLNAAEDGSESNAAPSANVARSDAAENVRTGTPKSASGAGGHIDGYLAGGRWREGSRLVDVAGQFKTSGERVAFHAADGKSRFPCLENLNSERVARIVAESPPESLEWIVRGTLTEFRNDNYLLVTQAVITSRAVRGARGAIDQRTPQAKGTRPPR
jgi:hypothetical protein